MHSNEPPLPAMPRKRTTQILDRSGQQLGNYRLIRLLADGGFAEVYLGEHVHLNTYAAIKILYAQLGGDDLAQFRSEARTVARLRHPHIVSILDFNVQNDIPFLVMDYAPNGNLRQRHLKYTSVPPPTIVTYLNQISDALQYAHREQVIHRDIKPENMLIGWHDEILLSDFGIAIVERGPHSQTMHDVIGTLAYMAPEQLEGKPCQASDQYSLGVVAYEWLCGEWPFHGSMAEISAQHFIATPPLLQQRNPVITPVIEEVVFKALAKDPMQRYPDVQGFAQAFERAVGQQQLYLHSSNGVVPGSIVPSVPNEVHLSATIQVAPLEGPAEVASAAPMPKETFRLTRRTLLFGLAGVTTMGLAGGGITWLVQAYMRSQQKHNSRPASQSTPTPSSLGSTLLTYFGHSDAVNTVVWSPSQRSIYIASGGNDHIVHVWFASSGSDARPTYAGHNDVVTQVAWSPNGQTLASASADKTVQVWKAFPGSSDTSFTYNGHEEVVNAVAWSIDGTRVASASNDGTVQIWQASDGSSSVTYSGHSDAVNTVAWSPDGTMLASGSNDETVRVWRASDNSDVGSYTRHSDAIKAVAWSPDGRYIASASADKTVQVWEATAGQPVYTYSRHSDVVKAVAWSPDGRYIASASADKTVQVWQVVP